MKKVFAIITIGVGIIVLLFVFIVSGAIFMFNPNPPIPEIQYGEFPFTLTYELDGEVKVVKDTVICEFEGFVNRGSAGKARKWKTSLKSGKEQITLLDLRPFEEINEFGQTMLELYFYYGTAAYYMGDESNPFSRNAQDLGWVEYKYQTRDGKIGSSAYKADVAWEKYKIKLISWEPSQPIKNSFK